MAELPFSAEYAKTGRASCKGCKNKIDQGALRLAVMVQSAFFDGKQANWFHDECFFKKQRPKSTADISKFNTLRNPDQKRITESIENYGSGVALPVEKGKGKGKKRGASAAQGAIKDFAIEYAKSSRATCRVCEIKICKDEVRISKTVFDTEIGQKYGGQALWHHVKCFAEQRASLLYLAGGEDLPGFKSLSKEDKAMVKAEIKPVKGDDVPIKKLKSEPKDKDEEKKEADLKSKMESQNDLYFSSRDALQNYTTSDLQELILANNQKIPTGKNECLALVADIMTFGSLAPCPECKEGQLVLDTYGYKCSGDLTEWTKCQYVTQQPKRKAFKVPKKFKNKAPFQKFKGKVMERLFNVAPQPSTYIVKSESVLAAVKAERPPPPLKNLQFFIYGKTKTPKEELKNKILKLGGSVPSKLSDVTAAVISTQSDVDKMSKKMEEIQEKDIEVVEESYLELIDKDKGTPSSSLQLIKENNIASWGSDPLKRVPQDVVDGKSMPKSGSLYVKSGKSAPQKLKLKGGTAVDPDSGLADEAHVYKDKHDTKWSVVLGLTDIVSQKNSFYKLQILEGDASKRYWLFRSWGRIGTTVGGNKTEPMSCDKAKDKFRELYLDKTANHWEARDVFKKVPGKMYPVDVDYGEQDDNVVQLCEDTNCKLPLPVQRLIMTIFDINLMKRVLLEFELDTEKMPLGKLSKKQIKAGYEVLSELLKHVEEGTKKGYMNQIFVVDATNRFYTLIPHSFGMQDPLLLSTEDRIKTKIEMLDNLLEIEIAYSLLKSESSSDQSPIEGHYTKLKAHIEPIDTGSPEFEMLLKYVKNTHGKTHSQYTLDIKQAFKVVREGEDKRYKPFKKLHNRRLLWHGSRTTNFAGILSQGLRIAPPEAPVTGYMFGKGIYFADMVSKSANYCCTNRNDPVGIMMLCEVALGNMKECMQSEYVTKLPPGVHSVWGRGRTMPDPAHDLVLDSGTIVPLGPPIDHPVNFSLLYNEKECMQSEYVTKLPPGVHSVWGRGRTMPDPAHDHVLDSGTIVPLGPPIDHPDNFSLLYNEFIVYDVAQVNVKYLFEMKFNYKY